MSHTLCTDFNAHTHCRCGKCNKTGHNKRTCPDLRKVDNAQVDEEEMQGAYNEVATEADGPPLTQPSQIENEVPSDEVENAGYDEAPIEEATAADDEAPIEIAAKKIQKLKCQKRLTTPLDAPIMVAAEKLKKLKERLKALKDIGDSSKMNDKGKAVVESQNEAEEARRMVIKTEMKDKIEAGKTTKRKSEDCNDFPPPLRRSTRLNDTPTFTFKNTSDNPVCLDEEADTVMVEENVSQNKEQHNTYTGPMKLGKQMPPPVKQFKTIVGKTKLKSAPFLSHGKNVITSTALRQAIDATAKNLKNESKGKHSSKGKEKET